MKIGLTGGIGSGKSTVTNYLRKKGYLVIDADKIARDITLPGSPTLERLGEFFGKDIILTDGSLDRKLLGERAFSGEQERKKLDEITHGEICDRIRRELVDAGERTVFVDAPLLFEVGLNEDVDQVWLIVADPALRVERVALRDNVSPDHVKSRINSQMGEEEKIRRADIVIQNTGTKEELYRKIDELLNQ